MKCAECGSEMVVSLGPVSCEAHGDTVTVVGIEHYLCQSCDEVLLHIDAAGQLQVRANEEYKKSKNLLTGSQIKAIRSKLGVGQSEFERMIKASSKSFTRWENDKVVQSGIADTLIRVLFAVPQALKYLQSPQLYKETKGTIPIIEQVDEGGVRRVGDLSKEMTAA